MTFVLLSLFVISIPQNEMKMTVKKVSLINFPTPDKRHIRFILCTCSNIEAGFSWEGEVLRVGFLFVGIFARNV